LELPFFAALILLLGPLLGAGHQIAAGHLGWTPNSHRISLLMVAFIPAFFFYFQGVKLFWRLLAESQAGTIEQVYLSPLPPALVAAAGRIVAAIIETLILMGVVYGIVSAFVTLHFHSTAAALVPTAFLMISGVGYSLIIAGMTLLWKRIQILVDVFLMLVMIFAVTGLWGTGGLVWVVVTAAAYLAAGITVFRVLSRLTRIRHARRLLRPLLPGRSAALTATSNPVRPDRLLRAMIIRAGSH
jgi:ABC-2 type transport system permease protein